MFVALSELDGDSSVGQDVLDQITNDVVKGIGGKNNVDWGFWYPIVNWRLLILIKILALPPMFKESLVKGQVLNLPLGYQLLPSGVSMKSKASGRGIVIRDGPSHSKSHFLL